MKLHLAAAALAGIVACTLALPAQSNPYEASMRDFLESEILLWAFDPTIVQAVEAQNEHNKALTQPDIDALDADWRSQVGTASQPLVDAVLTNPASVFLNARVAESAGTITEIFVMDNHGLNVAATGATSDYWQGDEAKFQQTYDVGAGAVHVGDVELDESTQTYQGQISVSIIDPDTREVIGAITVGLNAAMLY